MDLPKDVSKLYSIYTSPEAPPEQRAQVAKIFEGLGASEEILADPAKTRQFFGIENEPKTKGKGIGLGPVYGGFIGGTGGGLLRGLPGVAVGVPVGAALGYFAGEGQKALSGEGNRQQYTDPFQ